MHYYQFNIGDYAKKTRNLSLMEDLAFRRLLDLYYDKESPIPDDIDRVCRLIGMRDHSDSVSYILSEFFLKSEGFHRNARCDRDIAKYQAKAESAKKANKARWSAKKSDSGLKSDLKSESCQIPTNNQEPITNSNRAQSADTKRKRFSPPSLDAVRDYCRERRNSVDPQRFVDHYESNGWRVGKNPMKDWQAAVRNWERSAPIVNAQPAYADNRPALREL